MFVTSDRGAVAQGLDCLRRDTNHWEPDVVTLLTQTLVDANDVAFSAPAKPIGPLYDEDQAKNLAELYNWSIARDGKGWRRVVASPQSRKALLKSPP